MMVDQLEVRRIALALPETTEAVDRFAFSVHNNGRQKAFVWAWNERVHPKRPRVARSDVVAIRVANEAEKVALLMSDQETFFTEAHYDGFPAVLVRLPLIAVDELEQLIVGGWRCQAPRHLASTYVK